MAKEITVRLTTNKIYNGEAYGPEYDNDTLVVPAKVAARWLENGKAVEISGETPDETPDGDETGDEGAATGLDTKKAAGAVSSGPTSIRGKK